MNNSQEDKFRLEGLILGDSTYEAGLLARKMGDSAGEVLRKLISNKDPHVRQNVLELAGELEGVDNARLILASLNDEDTDVRILAGSLLDVCTHKELLPVLLDAMKKQSEKKIPDQKLLGSLALQIGVVGGPEQIPALKESGKKVTDPEHHRQFMLARARLGDSEARADLIRRLEHPIASERFQALRDCIYVQDKTLAANFWLALHDYREVIMLTLPGSPQQVGARICDVAVYVMKNLGYTFTFPVDSLWTRKDVEIEEARKVVAEIVKNQSGTGIHP